MIFLPKKLFRLAAATTMVSLTVFAVPAVEAKPNKALVSQAVNADKSLSVEAKKFYAERDYQPIWVGNKNRSRAKALLEAVSNSAAHGLPTAQYQISDLQTALNNVRGPDGATAEAFATQIFLRYAHDLSSGVLEPKKIDREIAVQPPRRSELALLDAISRSSPSGFFKALVPKHPEYARLIKEKKRLERLIGNGGFGAKVPVATLKPGTSSKNVAKMRARLSAMGYGRLGSDAAFDDKLVKVVQQFQIDHGLKADGVVGPGTIKVMNVSTQQRLKQVLVNLERERWMNRSRGKRHIVVNLADFSFNVYDNDRVSFTSVTVIGKVGKDRTPEFHDQMTHMVVNPTWHVPRSIAGKEYLPILKKDPGFLARRGMRMVGRNGKAVNPANVNLAGYSAKNFPYSIKQKPSKGNALGLVKFMFPNKYNIYLHDTPSKSLFKREVRAFSHGCVRVQKPFEFAYKLLEKQTSDPKGAFHGWLKTGREQYVNLQQPVPIYLNYRTAFFAENGRVNYRNDIYGRDKTIFGALSKAGVALQAVQG
jgi:murein L,D-transpeptidase YcbB/YkuD